MVPRSTCDRRSQPIPCVRDLPEGAGSGRCAGLQHLGYPVNAVWLLVALLNLAVGPARARWLISGRSSGPAHILMLRMRGPAWWRRGCQHESLLPWARDG